LRLVLRTSSARAFSSVAERFGFKFFAFASKSLLILRFIGFFGADRGTDHSALHFGDVPQYIATTYFGVLRSTLQHLKCKATTRTLSSPNYSKPEIKADFPRLASVTGYRSVARVYQSLRSTEGLLLVSERWDKGHSHPVVEGSGSGRSNEPSVGPRKAGTIASRLLWRRQPKARVSACNNRIRRSILRHKNRGRRLNPPKLVGFFYSCVTNSAYITGYYMP
jgi:hypothetical protein